jgi:hypothetical protein
MHSSSRTHAYDASEPTSNIDRLAEWLLSNCPFSTLTILALLVLGFAFDIPRPAIIVASVVTADVLLNLARRYRRGRRARAVTA